MNGKTRMMAYSVLVKGALAAVKYAFAWISGSIALAADATHSLCDVLPAVLILVCLFVSERRTRRFPRGLHKIENLVSLLVAFAIFYAGYEILHGAIENQSMGPLANAPLALAGALLSAVVLWVLARYELAVSQATGSPSIKADAEHSKADVFSSVVVAVGVAAGFAGLHIDWLAAVLVALFVFAAGAKILMDSVTVLLDGTLDSDTLKAAREIILSQPGVTAVRRLDGRNSGSHKILEIELEIGAESLAVAHAACDSLEKALRRAIPHLDRVLIHYEPAGGEVAAEAADPDVTGTPENQNATSTSPLVDAGDLETENGADPSKASTSIPCLGLRARTRPWARCRRYRTWVRQYAIQSGA